MRTLILLLSLLPLQLYAYPSSGGGYRLELLDEWNNSLPSYHSSGSTYVLGEYNRHYKVRVHNHSGQRIEAVITIDGRDAISGGSGDYVNQRGYVIDPYGSVIVEGFRQSMNQVASFRFTTPGDSYAGRMGGTSNLGVVGVAIFKERVRRVTYKRRHRPMVKRGGSFGAGLDSAGDELAAPMEEGESRAKSSRGFRRSAPRNNLGTRYGESRHSQAVEVPFVRARSARPNRILSVYYDNLAGLRSRGILPSPPDPGWAPNPFPNRDFAPPPY